MQLGEIPFFNGAQRNAQLTKGLGMFMKNSTAMMNHNRQMSGNRNKSTTLSRDINGGMSFQPVGFGRLGEDVVETSYGPEKSWKDLVLGDATIEAIEGETIVLTEPATRWNRQHRLSGLGETNWGEDLLSLVKTALPIYQQQKVFDQQLAVAKAAGANVVVNTPTGNVTIPAAPNYGKIAMLGGAGILGAFLLFKVLKRR